MLAAFGRIAVMPVPFSDSEIHRFDLMILEAPMKIDECSSCEKQRIILLFLTLCGSIVKALHHMINFLGNALDLVFLVLPFCHRILPTKRYQDPANTR